METWLIALASGEMVSISMAKPGKQLKDISQTKAHISTTASAFAKWKVCLAISAVARAQKACFAQFVSVDITARPLAFARNAPV